MKKSKFLKTIAILTFVLLCSGLFSACDQYPGATIDGTSFSEYMESQDFNVVELPLSEVAAEGVSKAYWATKDLLTVSVTFVAYNSNENAVSYYNKTKTDLINELTSIELEGAINFDGGDYNSFEVATANSFNLIVRIKDTTMFTKATSPNYKMEVRAIYQHLGYLHE